MLVPFLAQADNPAICTDAQHAAMQDQLDALNKRLEHLEQLLQSGLPPVNTTANTTTTDTAPASPPAASPAPHATVGLTAYQELEALHMNWKQLQRGLSRAELDQLLGKPYSELTLDQQTLWYYRYPGIGGGSVMLDSNDKVSGWQLPPFRGW